MMNWIDVVATTLVVFLFFFVLWLGAAALYALRTERQALRTRRRLANSFRYQTGQDWETTPDWQKGEFAWWYYNERLEGTPWTGFGPHPDTYMD